MKDMMIDIETLGSTRAISPVITQIGACYFDCYSIKTRRGERGTCVELRIGGKFGMELRA